MENSSRSHFTDSDISTDSIVPESVAVPAIRIIKTKIEFRLKKITLIILSEAIGNS